MTHWRAVAFIVCSVSLQGVVLSRLFGSSLLIHGSFLSRLIVIVAVTLTSFVCVNFFYRPRIKSSAKKAVLITGCDKGFGHALAKRLESQGFTVFAGCLDTTSESSKQLESDSGLMHVLQMDIASNDQILACAGQVLEVLRREGKYLWAVVNNAGIGRLGLIELLPLKDFEDQLNVNTLGPVRTTKAFIPLLRGHGRIINVASLASRIALPYFSAYSMSKYALLSFSDCLRREMAHFKIKVVTVEPSRYRTDLLSSAIHGEYFYQLWDTAEEHIRSQYGSSYYNESRKCMLTNIEECRENIEEVLDTIEQAIWSVHPERHYVPHAWTEFYVSILFSLPESLIDKLMIKKLLPRDVIPAYISRNEATSREKQS